MVTTIVHHVRQTWFGTPLGVMALMGVLYLAVGTGLWGAQNLPYLGATEGNMPFLGALAAGAVYSMVMGFFLSAVCVAVMAAWDYVGNDLFSGWRPIHKAGEWLRDEVEALAWVTGGSAGITFGLMFVLFIILTFIYGGNVEAIDDWDYSLVYHW